MKQPKRLTRNQKEMVRKAGYDPKDYGLVMEYENSIVIIHRATGKQEFVAK